MAAFMCVVCDKPGESHDGGGEWKDGFAHSDCLSLMIELQEKEMQQALSPEFEELVADLDKSLKKLKAFNNKLDSLKEPNENN